MAADLSLSAQIFLFGLNVNNIHNNTGEMYHIFE